MNPDDTPSPSAAAAAPSTTESASSTNPAASSSTAAASSSSSITVDQHLALTIQTLQQLTDIFNFPHHLSQRAIEDCGPEDVTLCYNYILDNFGGEVNDGGGPVVPREDCPHIERHVKFRIVDDGNNNGDGDGKLEKSCKGEANGTKNVSNGGGKLQIIDENGSLTALSAEFQKLCFEGNLMTSDCQHYVTNGSVNTLFGKRVASRKRLRSEEDASGRLKCEEDYIDNEDTNNGNEDGNENENHNNENKGEYCTKSPTPSMLKKTKPSCPKGENWLCLECGALLCSRYANGHAKLHYEDTKNVEREEIVMATASQNAGLSAEGHCVAVSLADLSVWCYECKAYLRDSKLDVLTKCLEVLKFGKDEEIENGCDKADNICATDAEAGGDNSVGGEGARGSDEMDQSIDDNAGGGAGLKSLPENQTNGEQSINCGNENVAKMEEIGGPSSSEEMDQDTNDLAIGVLKSPPENQSHSEPCNNLKSPPENQAFGDTINRGKPASLFKRKGTPRKLPPEQLGNRDMSSSPQSQQSQSSDDGSTSNNNNDNNDNQNDSESDSSSSSSSSSDDETSQQAALLASLLHGEHGDAVRAYLARHESFDTSNMGQCVPMHLPKPPSFPNEIADFLKSPLCKSIIVLAGAGMSVSSGIPDFRSAGVGLYDTLRPELLTATELEQALIEDDPTLALDKGMFLQNPLPMLETKRSFILGTYEKRWRATLAHRFVELLHTRLGKLTRLYTQNIDGLELQCTGLPKEKVITVHGSMGAAACEQCEQKVDFDQFCESVRSNIKDITGQDPDAPSESTPIQCEACGNPSVKPTIVLFRGSMPKEFHSRTAEDLPECDLLIVMGTSLTVAPANSLVYRVPPTALRMVMNNERVGRRLGIDYGENPVRDVYAHGHSDETCLELAEKMGWLDDLAAIVDELPESSARLLRERLELREGEKVEEE